MSFFVLIETVVSYEYTYNIKFQHEIGVFNCVTYMYLYKALLLCKTKNVLSAYFTSKQIMPFGFAEQNCLLVK